MNRHFLIFLLFLLVSPLVLAQSTHLSQLAKTAKEQAYASGFTLFTEGGDRISYDAGFNLGVTSYPPGYYYLVSLIDDCYSCKVEVIIRNGDTGEVVSRKPDMEYSGSVGGSGFTFTQKSHGSGEVTIFKSGEKSLDYGHFILFYKAL